MATPRNADVNLIVRARTEDEKAISGLGDSRMLSSTAPSRRC